MLFSHKQRDCLSQQDFQVFCLEQKNDSIIYRGFFENIPQVIIQFSYESLEFKKHDFKTANILKVAPQNQLFYDITSVCWLEFLQHQQAAPTCSESQRKSLHKLHKMEFSIIFWFITQIHTQYSNTTPLSTCLVQILHLSFRSKLLSRAM